MLKEDKYRLREEAEELEGIPEDASELAGKLGLDPYDVNYWVVDYDDINELAAYGGFQERYPHWRWGRQYEKRKKESEYRPGKILEMVVNDNPAEAYLQESNDYASQKGVIAHVEAHSDFFARNKWFRDFKDGDPNSAATLARHARQIEDYMNDHELVEEDSREQVEKWIDSILTIEDNIAQHRGYRQVMEQDDREEYEKAEEMREAIEELGLSDQVEDEVLTEKFYEGLDEDTGYDIPQEEKEDLLYFLKNHGKQYDDENQEAIPMDDWQEDVIEMLREESYYLAPQKMTKVMNEGWASYWDSKMMTDEGLADIDDIIDHAEGEAAMLNDSNSFNPYSLGLDIWEHIENRENRREVVSKLLQVESEDLDLASNNLNGFYDQVDFEKVYSELEPDEPERELYSVDFDSVDEIEGLLEEGELEEEKVDLEMLEKTIGVKKFLEDEEKVEDYLEGTRDVEIEDEVKEVLDESAEKLGRDDVKEFERQVREELGVDRHSWKMIAYEGLVEKNYSLTEPENRRYGDKPGFIENINHDELEEIATWEVEDWSRYGSVEEALNDVDMTRGWDKMFEERKNKNDITFLQENITQEFVDRNGYYTSEQLPTTEGNPNVPVVTSVDAEEVRNALVFKFTNFGKPTIQVEDHNFNNQGELLLAHQYNGVPLNKDLAFKTMERMHNLWGRPVHLKTVEKDWDREENDEILRELAMAQDRDGEMDWEGRITEPDEVGKLLTYDPEEGPDIDELEDEEVEDIIPDEKDLSTIPEDFLA